MAQYFQIHPENPQKRLIHQAVGILGQGGVIAYPTDSSYALGCTLDNKAGMERIRRIRRVDDTHHFTLVCRDLSEISTYARIDNPLYRTLKATTPGAYTFLLPATKDVPKRLQHPKRRTIGIRVPTHPIVQQLLEALDGPLASVTLMLADADLPMADPGEIREALEHDVDLVIDGGHCGVQPTTVVDLTDNAPRILRTGKGDPSPFEALTV